MSVPHRKQDSGGLDKRPIVSREKEPAHISGETYWLLMKGNISLKSLADAKDGKGLFTRPGDNIRALVDQYYDMMNAFTDVTWYPKKTTIQEAIELCNKDLDGKLLQGKEADKITKVRAEAYAVKSMFLEIINAEKSTSTGERLSSNMAALVKKFKGSRKLKDVLSSSPFLCRVKAGIASGKRKAEAPLPIMDEEPKSADKPLWKTPSPIRQPNWNEPDVLPSTAGEVVVSQGKSLADRLFPLDLERLESQDSLGSGPDIADIVQGVVAAKASSSSVDIPQLCKVDFYELLGLQRPGKKAKVVKPGPNGFVVEVTSDGERETDEPNLVFLNRGELAQFQKDKEAAQAEAKELAKEKKKAKAKERAAKKKNAKSLDPPKAKQSKSKKIETPGPAQHEPGQSAQGSAMSHYRDVRVTTAKTGVVRSYLTALDVRQKGAYH